MLHRRIPSQLRPFISSSSNDNSEPLPQSKFGWRRCMRYYQESSSLWKYAAMYDHMLPYILPTLRCCYLAELGSTNKVTLLYPELQPSCMWSAMASAINLGHTRTVIAMMEPPHCGPDYWRKNLNAVLSHINVPQTQSFAAFLNLLGLDPLSWPASVNMLNVMTLIGSREFTEQFVDYIHTDDVLAILPRWREKATAEDLVASAENIAYLFGKGLVEVGVMQNLIDTSPNEQAAAIIRKAITAVS